jgi:hypothetical protein
MRPISGLESSIGAVVNSLFWLDTNVILKRFKISKLIKSLWRPDDLYI